MSRREPEADDPDLELELDLRRFPAVVAARVDRGCAERELRILVVTEDPAAVLPSDVLAAVRSFHEGPVALKIVCAEAGGIVGPGHRRRARVQLVDVRARPDGGHVEVHLAYRGRRAVGTSSAGPYVGAATAALSALAFLGASVPYRVELITRLGSGSDAPLLVVLASLEGREERLGVVQGTADDDATVRAVLHALNRHLERTLDAEPEGPGAGQEGLSFAVPSSARTYGKT